MSRYSVKPNRAFSLIELLVVIAIVGVLMAVLLPSLRQAREVANQAVEKSNYKSMMLGYFNYATDNRDSLITYNANPAGPNYNGTYAWDETILNPYFAGSAKIGANVVGGATKLMAFGCTGRRYNEQWSMGVNGAVHTYVPREYSTPAYYNTTKPAKFAHFRKAAATHVFSDMVQGYKRYPNHSFYTSYLLPNLPRVFRHEGAGIGAAFADGHAEWIDNKGPASIWTTTWHYATSCSANGCYWHAYNSTWAVY